MDEEINIRQIVLYEYEGMGAELELEEAGPWVVIDSKASLKASMISHLQHLWDTYPDHRRAMLDYVIILEARMGDGRPRRIFVDTTEGPQFSFRNAKTGEYL